VIRESEIMQVVEIAEKATRDLEKYNAKLQK
jgi:hypothetical protein